MFFGLLCFGGVECFLVFVRVVWMFGCAVWRNVVVGRVCCRVVSIFLFFLQIVILICKSKILILFLCSDCVPIVWWVVHFLWFVVLMCFVLINDQKQNIICFC